jgi:hypothetical protein
MLGRQSSLRAKQRIGSIRQQFMAPISPESALPVKSSRRHD